MTMKTFLCRYIIATTVIALATTARAESPGTVDDILAFAGEKMNSYKDWYGNFTQTMSLGATKTNAPPATTPAPAAPETK